MFCINKQPNQQIVALEKSELLEPKASVGEHRESRRVEFVFLRIKTVFIFTLAHHNKPLEVQKFNVMSQN